MPEVVANARMGFEASKGNVLIGIDFCNQEMITAAVLSKDPIMIAAFKEPEKLTAADGTVYGNPAADLHTMTAKNCCFPQLFIGKTEEEWVKIAKNEDLCPRNGCSRDWGRLFAPPSSDIRAIIG
jgi:hypothetical protein